MEESLINELKRCGQILEDHFHDMIDFDFTVENNKLYIFSSRIGKRTDTANIKIVIDMFCKGKM
ncbi:MAG: hypothetical protein K2N71_06185, partial [Oscillospiraceae bacterium]|nr:hypothetical protein [Oscillospiraceae bacterium]